jgi:hypothetical protein
MSWTCGKGLSKFLQQYFKFQKLQIPYLLNYEFVLNLGSRLLSYNYFYHQKYFINIIIFLLLCKTNHILRNYYSSSNIFY